MENKGPISCSFCGNAQDKVRHLVAAQSPGVFICNQCVDLCAQLLKDQGAKKEDISAIPEEQLMADIDLLEEQVRRSINSVMENRLTASHLISDVYALLEHLSKLKAKLVDSLAKQK